MIVFRVKSSLIGVERSSFGNKLGIVRIRCLLSRTGTGTLAGVKASSGNQTSWYPRSVKPIL